MYPILIIVGMLFINLNIQAGSEKSETTTAGGTIYDFIQEVLPDDYQTYKRNFKNDNSIQDVQSVFKLLDKIKVQLLKYPTSDTSTKKYNLQDAYRWLWYKGLTICVNSKDENATDFIQRNWDKCLKEDDANLIPFQIVALKNINEKNSRFLDEIFWELLKSTNDERVISAICQVIMRDGSDEDRKKLVDKSEQTNNEEIKKIISEAIFLRKQFKHDAESRKNNPNLPKRAAGLPDVERFRSSYIPQSVLNTPKQIIVKSPITLCKISNEKSEDKSNWVAEFKLREKDKNKLKFMKIGDTVLDYEIKDLSIENVKEGEKEVTIYRMTVKNKNTNEEEIFERKK